MSTRGKTPSTVDSAGHYIQVDQPQVVIDSILEIVRKPLTANRSYRETVADQSPIPMFCWVAAVRLSAYYLSVTYRA